MKVITYVFSIAYFIIVFFVIDAVLYNQIDIQYYLRPLACFALAGVYLTMLPKKRWNKLYIFMLFLALLSQLSFIEFEVNTNSVLVFYFLTHVTFIALIYKYILKKKTLFDIFTFSLPFFLAFSIIFVLLSLDFEWGFKTFIFGIGTCLNASIILLAYVNDRNIANYLLYVGILIWFVVDAFGGVYMFRFREDIYYLLAVTLDLIAQAVICAGMILHGLYPNKKKLSMNF